MTFCLHQLVVFSALDDLPVLDDKDHVRISDRREAVRDNYRGAPFDDLVDRRLDLLFGQRVDGGGRLVEDQYFRVGDYRPRERDKLFLTRGEAVAALLDVGVEPALEFFDNRIRKDEAHRALYLLVRRVGVSVEKVFPDRAGEEVRRLQHIPDGGVQPQLGALPRVLPVDQNTPTGGFKEPANQVHQGGLARTGLADDGNIRSEGDFQVEMLQHILVAVRIAEGYVVEFDVAADGFPVLFFRDEGVAVGGDDFRRIRDVGLRIQQAGKPLDIHLGGNHIRDGVHNPADGLHHALRIGHKHGEGTDFLGGDIAALPQDNREGHGGCQVHRHREGAAQASRPDGLALVFLGVGHKVLRHFFFDDQRFDRLGAGDAFVEIPGDLRVLLADFPVGQDQLPLENREQDHDQGEDQHDQQRQPCVDHQHDHQGAHQVAGVPHRVHQGPGDQPADAGSIRHDPGMDPAHAVLIIIGKGQRLQVVERFGAQVPVDGNLGFHRSVAGDEVDAGSEQNQEDINYNEPGQGIQGIARDEMVERVTLQHRHQDIHAGAQQAAHDHPGQQFPVLLQVREEPGDAEEGQGLLLIQFFRQFHYASTPFTVKSILPEFPG